MDENVEDNGVQDDYMDSDEDNEVSASKELPAVARRECSTAMQEHLMVNLSKAVSYREYVEDSLLSWARAGGGRPPWRCCRRHNPMYKTERKFEVPFNSSREAEIARNSLQVDPEPRRGGSKKTFALKDNILCVEIRSVDVRQLRSAVCSFMDLLNLVTKTIDQFGPPVQQSKKMCV